MMERTVRLGLILERIEARSYLGFTEDVAWLLTREVLLTTALKIYFHAHETGNSVPPYLVEQARSVLSEDPGGAQT